MESELVACVKVAILSHRLKYTRLEAVQPVVQQAAVKKKKLTLLHRSKAKTFADLHKRLLEQINKGSVDGDEAFQRAVKRLVRSEAASPASSPKELVARFRAGALLESGNVVSHSCSFIDILTELTSSSSSLYSDLVQLRKDAAQVPPRVVEPEISYESLELSEVVCDVFGTDRDGFVSQLVPLTSKVSLGAYFSQLRGKLQVLNYRPADFAEPSDFDKWAREESYEIKRLLDAMVPLVNKSSEPFEVIPPPQLFEGILRRCLESQKDVGPASDLYLDPGKLALLDECIRLWRVDGFVTSTLTLNLFLEIVCKNGDLRNLSRAFELSKHLGSSVTPNVSRWPVSAQKYRKEVMKSIFNITLDATAQLIKTLPNTAPQLKRLLLLQEKMFDDASLDPRSRSALQSVLKDGADECHNELFLQLLKTGGTTELYAFFETINAILLKFPAVADSIIFKSRLSQLALVSLQQKMLQFRQEKVALDYGDIYVLYVKQVRPLRAMSSVDIQLEELLYPEMKLWVQDAVKKLEQQTREIISREEYVPEDDDKRSSHGVVLLFEQFNAVFQLLQELAWRDDKTRGRLYCIAVSGVCSCIESYGRVMLSKVTEQYSGINPLSCVALNNLNAILENMNILEDRTDFEKLPKPAPTKHASKSLFVKVVGGETILTTSGRPPDLRVRLGAYGSTHVAFSDTDPVWNEEFQISLRGDEINFNITLEDCSTSKVLMECPYKASVDSFDGEKTLVFKVGATGRLTLSVFLEINEDNAVFYMRRTRRLMVSAKERALHLLSSRFDRPIKECLCRETVSRTADKAIKREEAMNPVCDFINSSFAVFVQYLNLVTMDEVRMYVWNLVLKKAEVIVLPLLSKRLKGGTITDLMKSMKLSRHMSLNDVSIVIFFVDDIKNTIFKQDEDLFEVPKYKQFAKIFDLYQLSDRELKDRASLLMKHTVPFLSESVATPPMSSSESNGTSSARAYYEMTLILRILLAKGNLNFVRKALTRIYRLNAAVTTEASWQKLYI